MKERLGWKALAAVSSSAFAAVLVAWTFSAGCTWPDYAVEDSFDSATGDSAALDTTTDVRIDTGPFVLPDGRICSGHDEDLDGVPDECDNCPNVVNPAQGIGTVGDACQPSAAFIAPATRLYFDPFKKLSPDFKPFPDAEAGPLPFSLGSDSDSLVGGVSTVGDADLRFIVAATGSDTSAVTVTTLITTESTNRGNTGILLRVNGSPPKFLICALSIDDGFAAAHAPDTGCSGSTCNAVAFPLPTADGGAIAAQAPIPSDIPHAIGDAVGLRASVMKSDSAGDFECRVFNPKVPSTLQSTDAKYAVRVSVPTTRWLTAGEVGLYAQSAHVHFSSIDVLRGP